MVDRAQAEIYDVTERRTQRGLRRPRGRLLQPTMDEIEAIATRGGELIGVPTGFYDLDGCPTACTPAR